VQQNDKKFVHMDNARVGLFAHLQYALTVFKASSTQTKKEKERPKEQKTYSNVHHRRKIEYRPLYK
jgi:hypothetical protein